MSAVRPSRQHASTGRMRRAGSVALLGLNQRRASKSAWAHLYNIPHAHDVDCHHPPQPLNSRRRYGSWAPSNARRRSEAFRPPRRQTSAEVAAQRPELATIKSSRFDDNSSKEPVRKTSLPSQSSTGHTRSHSLPGVAEPANASSASSRFQQAAGVEAGGNQSGEESVSQKDSVD